MWDLDGNESTTFRLRSPGISVCWHPEEAFKVGGVYFRYMLVFWGQIQVSCLLASTHCTQIPLAGARSGERLDDGPGGFLPSLFSELVVMEAVIGKLENLVLLPPIMLLTSLKHPYCYPTNLIISWAVKGAWFRFSQIHKMEIMQWNILWWNTACP